ncbi:hypothetical protein [Morganella morganii]|uniref:hypothetical protein n=1 Tax=Morganella morganii TaxID=582 RepID=UPI003AB05454
MADIILGLALLSLLAFVIGIIKPQIVKMPNRKKVSIFYLGGFLVMAMIAGALFPDVKNEPQSSQEQQTEKVPAKPAETVSVESAQQATNAQTSVDSDLCKSDYKTALDAFTDLGDYYADNNSLEIISEAPLHIRLSNLAVQGDHPDVKELMVKRAVIYGIYRSFIHTNKDEVTVTSYLIDMNNKKKLPGSPEYSVKITKKQALDIIKKYIPVQDYSDLIAKDGYGCSFSEDFNQVRFNDQNENEFNAFFSDLSSANK